MSSLCLARRLPPTVEDYLRTIYALQEEVEPVIAARVAEEVGVAPSTMVSTLRRREGEGYLKVVRRKEIHLTSEGKQFSERTLRRHVLVEQFLTNMLGLAWVKAYQESAPF